MITLFGSMPPSKKNSRKLFTRGHRIFNLPSDKYTEWHEDASWQLKKFTHSWRMQPFYEIELRFFPDSRIKFDLSNKAESVMDLLTDNGFIQDDNYIYVPKLTLVYGGYDKENPRVEIEVKNNTKK